MNLSPLRYRSTVTAWLVVGIMLCAAISSLNAAPQANPSPIANLQLVLAGPFVVCDTGGNTLRVLVPNVIENPPDIAPGTDFSHYPPGFTATLNETSLQEGPTLVPPKDFSLQLPGYKPHKPLVFSDSVALIDQVKVTQPANSVCLAQSDDVYAVLTIPKPDEIYGMLPETATITHPAASNVKVISTAVAGPAKYATQFLLFYRNVDLTKVHVCQGTTVFWPKPTALTNCGTPPAGAQPLFRNVGGQAVLTFDMRRKMEDLPSPDPHNPAQANPHAQFVNGAMVKAAGVNRTLSFPVPQAQHVSHGDCNGGGMFVCAGAGNSCP